MQPRMPSFNAAAVQREIARHRTKRRAPLLAVLSPQLVLLLLGTSLLGVLDAKVLLEKKGGGSQSQYTANMMCRPNNCVNPLFPAFMNRGQDILSAQEKRAWECVENPLVANLTSFCGRVIRFYPFSIPQPAPAEGEVQVEDIMKREEREAMKAYVMHLAGLGYDYWDFQEPWNADPCVKSVWEMSCYTYFPRCNDMAAAKYLRPCQSTCRSYLASCNVECCDEGVKCIFQEEMVMSDGTAFTQSGYVDHAAPSPLCTGSGAGQGRGRPNAFVLLLLLLAAVGPSLKEALPGFAQSFRLPGNFGWANRAAALALGRKVSGRLSGLSSSLGLLTMLGLASTMLMGCDIPKLSGYVVPTDVKLPGHSVPFWRMQQDYSMTYAYTHPQTNQQGFDSCSDPTVSYLHVCGGNGHCEPWDPEHSTAEDPGLLFCRCNEDWADPECRTKRKSQFHAYLLSLLIGYTGADYAYLGFPYFAGFKMLFSLITVVFGFLISGQIGFLLFFFAWVYDVIRVGSGNIYANDFRVAADLDQWFFVNGTFVFFAMLGFMAAMAPAFTDIRARRRLADGSSPKGF